MDFKVSVIRDNGLIISPHYILGESRTGRERGVMCLWHVLFSAKAAAMSLVDSNERSRRVG